jgi:NAD(P)-dependent dehydrogenase (short-subunit alcohol dehydrogenase family)
VKKVLITGTGSGIGKQLAVDFQQNYLVISVSRKLSTHSHHIVCDLSLPNEYRKIVEYIDLNPDFKPDVVIHNAATLINKPLISQTDDEVNSQIQLNFMSPLFLTRELLKRCPTKKSLHIYIASMAGFQNSKKIPGLSVYGATKGALLTLSQCLAEEYKDTGHRFIGIALGATNTQMKPQVSDNEIQGMSVEYVSSCIKQLVTVGESLFNGEIVRLDEHKL